MCGMWSPGVQLARRSWYCCSWWNDMRSFLQLGHHMLCVGTKAKHAGLAQTQSTTTPSKKNTPVTGAVQLLLHHLKLHPLLLQLLLHVHNVGQQCQRAGAAPAIAPCKTGQATM